MDIDFAYFSYVFSKQRFEPYSNAEKFYDYFISYSANTECYSALKDSKMLSIVGVCVDSHGKIERSRVPSHLLENTESIIDLIKNADRLAGRYVIFFHDGFNIYALTDATGTVQVNYYFNDGEVVVSSNVQLIGDLFNLSISKYSQSIKEQAALTQALPNDITMFDEIKCLLPNHYLSLKDKNSIRFWPCGVKLDTLSVDIVAERTITIVKTIINEYAKYFRFALPLTGGIDSRLILSFLHPYKDDLKVFTFNHPWFTTNTPDVFVPTKICEDLGLDYQLINDITANKDQEEHYRKMIGSYYDTSALNWGNTYINSNLADRVSFSSDIVDQIGKSLLGHFLPEPLATTGYLVTKTHNYSSQNRREIKAWRQNVVKERGNISIYDLFAWEHRCGRWGVQSTLVLDQMMTSLNCFNCRELILEWLCVPRKKRTERKIHTVIMANNWPKLIEYPVNPGSTIIDIIDKIPILFYLATFAKYYYESFYYKYN